MLVSADEHPDLTQAHIDAHQELVIELRETLLDTYRELAAGTLSARDYAENANNSINAYKSTMREVLGDALHVELYEDIAAVEVTVVEPAIAETVFADGPTYP